METKNEYRTILWRHSKFVNLSDIQDLSDGRKKHNSTTIVLQKKDYELSGVNVLLTKDDLEHLLNLIYSCL